MKKLNPGDRVVRVVEDLKHGTAVRIRRGVVDRAYASMSSGVGQSVPLYDVRWDDTGAVEVGYMEGNLEPEPLAVGIVIAPTTR